MSTTLAAKPRTQVYSLTDHFRSRFGPTKSIPWFVAAETFDVPGDPAGGFVAGRTRIAGDHEYVKRWPHRFRRESGRSVGVASRAQPIDTAPVVQKPHLYHPVPPPRIEISDGAWSRLSVELKDSEADLETGGFVYANGHQRDLYVAAVTECVAKRGTHSLEFDGARRHDDDLQWRESGLLRCGVWHSHPGADRGEPSDTDLEAWQAGYELLEKNTDRFIALILTPSRSAGWWAPEVHGYVCSRDSLTKAVRVEVARTNWDAA